MTNVDYIAGIFFILVEQMSADFHLFLRLMIPCNGEFFRQAFVVLEAICSLTFVEHSAFRVISVQ